MNEILAVAAQVGGLGGLFLAICVMGLGLAGIAPPWKRATNEAARDRAAERGADFDRIREEVKRISGRLKEVEEREGECQRKLAGALDEVAGLKRRIAALEGYNDGQGRAANDAQLIVSTERQIDAAARKIPRKPGLRRDKP